MSERSDFAQKLLDDLRLRKERMNAPQKSSQSNQLPIDAYAYSKQTHRGSRSYKGGENVSSRTGNVLNRSSRSHRSAKVGEVSNQIVTYGRGQRLEQTGDMSLALAFPLENGGKLRRSDSSLTNSIMNFLGQLKRGTSSFGKMERRGGSGRQLASTSQFPALSPVQISEICKGAQKLNQILSASHPNGLTIDRHSIEFAKELLQGAINLEESLRIIVDQQKNLEFIVTPQKKNQVILLEEEEEDVDDETKTLEQKQLAPPIFSFDKRSKHSQNFQGNQNMSLKQTNYFKGKKLNNEKQDVNTSKLLPHHKRSTSYGSNAKSQNAVSEQNNQLASVQSDADKSGIPSVVAKLMGLDNLPGKVEVKHTPQKGSDSAQKMGVAFKHTPKGSQKKMELNSRQTANLLPQKKQKVIESTTMPATQHKELGVDKNLNTRKVSSEVVVDNGIRALKGSDKASIKKDKQNDSAVKVNFMRPSQIGVQEKEKRQDHISNREQKGTGKGRTNNLNNMLNQMEQVHGRSEVTYLLQEQKETSGSIHQSEKRHTNMHIVGNQKMCQYHLGIEESNLALKYGPQQEKYHKKQWLQLSEKEMFKARSQRGSETPSNNLSQRKQLFINHVASLQHNSAENTGALNSDRSSISYYDNLVRDEVSNGLNVQIKEMMKKESCQLSSPTCQEPEKVKGKRGIQKVMVEKGVHKITDKKVKSTRKQKIDMPGKIDEVLTRRNRKMLQIPKQIKQHSPIMQQVMQRTSDRINISKEAERERVGTSKEADTRLFSSNAPVATTEPLEVRYQPHKVDEMPPTLYNDGELQCSQKSEALVPNYLHEDVKSVTIRDLQDQAALVTADEGIESGQIAPYTINGVRAYRMNINSHLQAQGPNISRKSPKPLTESENRLKWNLIKSQLFLNTAETLFRFDMPFSNPLGSGWDNQDLSSKLMLDCGYEVMKRKGIRQEFKAHPCSKISISTMRIRSLDDLVRQLDEDIEKLTFCGRSRISRVEVDDYLPKMLANDVYNKDPDIDCMWELGWNDDTFAFIEKYEAIRNMEKHVLNGLLDEITTELWHFQGLNM
ncbi:uncharacterized protein LOC129309895 isoform X2 [Prosopis cineraria]|uniref:uncharacterized protein LOC129309895 isoform X2 n=1 Tax=Prosopis cineraria TaxID=364024 RepID=UPI00241051DD|nr:uncharacterized protein LOC129309895 isoform X2 [Prosopis cineraria]